MSKPAAKPPIETFSETTLPKTIPCWVCAGTMQLEAVLDWVAWFHCSCNNYECRHITQDRVPIT